MANAYDTLAVEVALTSSQSSLNLGKISHEALREEGGKGESPSTFTFPPYPACYPEEWTRHETCIATLPPVIITLPSFLLILSTESAHTMCKLLFFAFFCHFGFANRFTRSLWKGTGTLKSDMRLTWLPRPEVSEIPWHFLDKCKISLTNSELS